MSNSEILSEFFTKEELAAELRRNPRTLDRWEVLGMGPPGRTSAAKCFIGGPAYRSGSPRKSGLLHDRGQLEPSGVTDTESGAINADANRRRYKLVNKNQDDAIAELVDAVRLRTRKCDPRNTASLSTRPLGN